MFFSDDDYIACQFWYKVSLPFKGRDGEGSYSVNYKYTSATWVCKENQTQTLSIVWQSICNDLPKLKDELNVLLNL